MTIEFDKNLPEHPSMEDLLERHRSLVLERKSMEKLLEHPGWKAFEHLVLSNARTVKASTENAFLENLEAVFKENHLRGIASGLERLLQLIPATKPHYDMELAKLEAQILEKQNGGRTSSSDDRDDTYDAGGGDSRSDEPELPFNGAGTDLVAP